MSEAPTEPTVSEVEASEVPDMQSVPVQVQGPVRVQHLPATSGEMRSRDDITTTPKKLFDADPRRKRLLIISNTAPTIVGRSQAECSSQGAHLPTGSVVELTHREAVWVASESGTQTVSFIHELWTD